MPLDMAMALLAADRYDRERDRYRKLARLVEAECQEIVSTRRILATVQSRAKTPESFAQKLIGYIDQNKTKKTSVVNSPDDAIRIVGDLAGVRVATYVEGDRQRVIESIKLRFRIALKSDGEEDIEEHDKDSGYRATHLQVLLPSDSCNSPDAANIRETPCEIQVCSMLAHVWNEVEHDMRYKDAAAAIEEPLIGDQLDMLLKSTHEGDDNIEQLLLLHSSIVAKRLVDDLAADFPNCSDFRLNAREVITEIVRLGYDTPSRIRDELLKDQYLVIAAGHVQTINDAIDPSDEISDLDPNTADLLLAILLSLHARDVKAVHLHELKSGNALRVARVANICMEQGLFTL